MNRHVHMPIAATVVAGGALARSARPWSGIAITAAPQPQS
jgi:hypothetical protein